MEIGTGKVILEQSTDVKGVGVFGEHILVCDTDSGRIKAFKVDERLLMQASKINAEKWEECPIKLIDEKVLTLNEIKWAK